MYKRIFSILALLAVFTLIVLCVSCTHSKNKEVAQKAPVTVAAPAAPVKPVTVVVPVDAVKPAAKAYTAAEKVQVIEKNLALIEEINNGNKRELSSPEVGDTTAAYITNLINSGSVTITGMKGVEKDVALGDVDIYSFAVNSWGTRRMVTYPIIVHKNGGRVKAENLAPIINCQFEQIFALSKYLYLLTGHEGGSGAGHQSIAYVIYVKGDRIDCNYPAFVNRPFLNFTGGTYRFNPASKTLTFILDKFQAADNLGEIFYYYDRYGKFNTDTASAVKLRAMIYEDYYETRSFTLQFNGRNFRAHK